MTDHHELADRIERADGPDLRELECRIWAALDKSGISFEAMRAVVKDFSYWAAPEYLRSIDAAMQLVPEGCDVCLSWSPDEPANAAISPAMKVAQWHGGAWNPAQALCAAALRAQVQL